MKNVIMKSVMIFLSVLTLIIQSSSVFAVQPDGAAKTLKVGFTTRVFPDVDQRDAQIAMELWTRELARGMGIKVAPQTIVYKTTGEMLDAVKHGELTFVTITALEFLQFRDKAPLTPSVVSESNAGKGRQYVLVVHKDSGINSVADLRNRSIALLTATKHESSHIWLDVLLMKAGYRDRTTFFRQAKESTSASQAIMAVFFKQSDAALVTLSSLETSKTLNPQVGKQLKIIAESKGLQGDISCVPNMVDEKMKRTLENAALHLHETTVGKQIFTLFQTEKIIPYKSAYLDGLVELLRERDRLMAKQKRKP
jgi:phosphonate transport system substrate-binding protein